MNEVKTKVEYILMKYPQTRNSDKDLYITYLSLHTNFDGIGSPQDAAACIRECEEYESITRCRRKIQNEDCKYLPTSWKVAKGRKMKEEWWRENVRDL